MSTPTPTKVLCSKAGLTGNVVVSFRYTMKSKIFGLVLLFCLTRCRYSSAESEDFFMGPVPPAARSFEMESDAYDYDDEVVDVKRNSDLFGKTNSLTSHNAKEKRENQPPGVWGKRSKQPPGVWGKRSGLLENDEKINHQRGVQGRRKSNAGHRGASFKYSVNQRDAMTGRMKLAAMARYLKAKQALEQKRRALIETVEGIREAMDNDY